MTAAAWRLERGYRGQSPLTWENGGVPRCYLLPALPQARRSASRPFHQSPSLERAASRGGPGEVTQ